MSREHSLLCPTSSIFTDSLDQIGKFRVFPYENLELEPFETAVTVLNPVVAVKLRSAAVHAVLAELYVYIPFRVLE